MTTKYKRIGAVFLVPLLFLLLGYASFYIIGAPIIQFVRSSIGLILLNDTPTFKHKYNDIFSSKKSQTETAETTTDVAAEQNLKATQLQYPKYGDLYGELQIPEANINEQLYYGDSEEILRLGAGQYSGSVLPGELGTTLIAGHNTSTFNYLDMTNTGDQILIETSYGKYTYAVSDKKVLAYNDPNAIAQLYQRQQRELIIYTCYPVDMLGSTDMRLFIYANYLSGPIISENS